MPTPYFALFLRVSLLGVAAAALVACNDLARPSSLDGLGAGSGGQGSDPAASCATPNDGCPCPEEGRDLECGTVVSRTESAVTCSIGKRACRAGKWTACEGEYVAVRSLAGLRPLGLGSTPTSCASTCDPGCIDIRDTATSDLDAGASAESGLLVSPDGGLQLAPGVPDGGTPCTALTLSPPTSTVTITGVGSGGVPTTSPVSVRFTPALTPAACFTGVPPAAFTLSRYDTATIAPTGELSLFASVAGDLGVTAFTGPLSATATVHVVVNARERGATVAPGTATALYDGAGSATNGAGRPVDTMRILYPYADVAADRPTVLPLGLAAPVLQWSTGGVAAAAVKVSLRHTRGSETLFDWSIVVPESTLELERVPGATGTTVPIVSNGPAFRIPQDAWAAFESSARGRDAVIGLQRLVGTTLRQEKTVPLRFANGQLKGTVYYQSYGTRLALNYTYANTTMSGNPDHRFGAATLAIRPGNAVPTLVAGSSTASANSADASRCFVCHTVAASGSRLITTYQDGAAGFYARFRVELTINALGQAVAGTPAQLGANADTSPWAWGGISPNGQLLFNSSSPKSGDRDGVASELWSFPVSGAPARLVAGGNNGLPANLRGALPGWSPSGASIAFTARQGLPGSSGRDLGAIDFDRATNTFRNARVLHVSPAPPTTPARPYASGASRWSSTAVWPSWTPDNTRVVFERELVDNGRDYAGTRSECESDVDCATAGQSNNQGSRGELWIVSNAQNAASSATSPARSVRLESANGRKCDGPACAAYVSYLPADPASAHDRDWELQYEPTVNPVEAGGYQWIVMVSRRMYGNVATVNPFWSDPRFKDISTRPTTKKLWVAAIDRATGAISTDPSYPAFYLPGQELMAGNTRGYWVLDACRPTGDLCATNDDCCGGTGTAPTSVCRIVSTSPLARRCASLVTNACAAVGQACATSADCCGLLQGSQCAASPGGALVCQAPPPLVAYPDATFTREFEGRCPRNQEPRWTGFEWRAETPGDSFVEFDASSAARSADFTGIPFVTLGRVPDRSGVNAYPGWTIAPIATLFTDAGIAQERLLRVRMHLGASSDRKKTPVLHEWRARYTCFVVE